MSFNNDLHSLSHTKWICKFHIVIAPKYRRKVFFYAKREAIREKEKPLAMLVEKICLKQTFQKITSKIVPPVGLSCT